MNAIVERYSGLSRAVHWVTAALIFGLFVMGLYMGEIPKSDPARAQFYFLHQSVGVLTVVLLVLRLVWLRVNPAPALPSAFSAGEQRVTKAIRALLYLLMVLVPLSGYVIVSTAGRDIPFFGLFELPGLIGKNGELHETAEEMHEFMAFGIIGLVLLHMAGAIKHRLKNKGGETDVLARML